MVLVASLALATSLQVSPACSWERPGAHRYTGELVASVDHYADIPAATRAKLKRRLAHPSHYDDQVLITRDAIEGSAPYDPGIEGMHFGANQVCRSVSRDRWSATDTQRGLVYCEDGQCLLVPSVCGNLARVTRHGPPGPSGPAGPSAPPIAAAPPGGVPSQPSDGFELPTEPTGAGITPVAGGSGTSGPPTGDSFATLVETPSGAPLVSPPTVTSGGISPGVRPLSGAPPPVQVPPVTTVPEPASGLLLLLGIAALAARGLKATARRVPRASAAAGARPAAARRTP